MHCTANRLLILCMLLLIVGCAKPREAQPTATPQSAEAPTAAQSAASPTPAEAASSTATAREGAVNEAASSGGLPQDVVALVNGAPIAASDYAQQVAQAEALYLQQRGLDALPAESAHALDELRERILGWMIDQELIEQAAREEGLAIAPEDVEAEINRMRNEDAARFDAWLAANGLTLDALREQLSTEMLTAAVRDWVTSQLSRIESQVHARHILASEESAAEAALERLERGEGFDAVARKVSEDESTRERGGDLGFLPRGVMPPEFDEAAFGLEAGEISGVVRTGYGYHVVQVVAVDSAREVSDDLWPVLQQRSFEDWLAQRRAEADIAVDEDLGRHLSAPAGSGPAS